MPASGDHTTKRLARPLSAKAMAARFKEHLGSRQIAFHSFRVGCAVTQTIAKRIMRKLWRLLTGSRKRMHAGMWEARGLRGIPPEPHPAPCRHDTVRPTHWRHPWTRQCGPYFPQGQHPPAGSRDHRRSPPLHLRFLHRETFLERNFDCTALDRLAAFICECWG